MKMADSTLLAWQAVIAHKFRTLLILLAMGIGVAAVILLTTLGETGRAYITGQFSSLGTNLLIVLPGRNETTGGAPPLLGTTPRDLTLGDALAVARSPYVERLAPIIIGGASAATDQGLVRDTTVLGTTAEMAHVRSLNLSRGRFLPAGDPYSAEPVCVIGITILNELFRGQDPVGQRLQLGDRKYRIIGVLSDEGVSVGIDFNDMVLLPVAAAQQLFNREGLFRMMIEMRSAGNTEDAIADVRRIITDRHEGEDDVTIITQDSLVSTFDRILSAVTYGIGGIGAISLVVAGILIMNVMLVSVTQRTAEVGLLKALGSSSRNIERLFLIEAIILSCSGAIVGVSVGLFTVWLMRGMWPTLPIHAPVWALVAAVAVAITTGLAFGTLPARRAARLDPVQALSRR
ncbi:MAG: ABC transporter permease [Gammaproteobacteria bacterium]|nr:ABC transporter permease [Gammaproteobacteria bacterium]